MLKRRLETVGVTGRRESWHIEDKELNKCLVCELCTKERACKFSWYGCHNNVVTMVQKNHLLSDERGEMSERGFLYADDTGTTSPLMTDALLYTSALSHVC
jgi:hypothetical protein